MRTSAVVGIDDPLVPISEQPEIPIHHKGTGLRGKRVGMVVFSSYPADPRPRRTVEALLKEGMHIDLICESSDELPKRELANSLEILRVPIRHHRGSRLSYAYQYVAFILISTGILAWRSLFRRYDLIYIHNMPDILVLSALFPKARGARVILDEHDPMPELMLTIFNLQPTSVAVKLMSKLEKWSIACADLVITVNLTCKRLFASRSCPSEKIGIVMNSPDGDLFPHRSPRAYSCSGDSVSRPFVVMYHGTLVERNGLGLAVEALAHLRGKVPNVELRIYGQGTRYLETVLEFARLTGVEDSIHYMGPRALENLAEEIERCDVGVIPNARNAFTEINMPTRIFEYLALGKPVIAPRTSGIQEYFDPEALLFFEPGNSQELAVQIAHVFAHPDQAMETAERGQQVYLAHVWSKERQTLINLVGGLLDESSEKAKSFSSSSVNYQLHSK